MPKRVKKKRKRKSKGKYRKNSRAELALPDEEIQYLVEKTAYDASEISEWFK